MRKLLLAALSLTFAVLSIFAGGAFASDKNMVGPEGTDPGVYYPGSTTVQIKPGDMLVTNNTSSNGLTGHAAIVIDTVYCVETLGPGYYPQKTTISDFFRKNSTSSTWVKVVRHSNTSAATNAAKWAASYVSTHSSTPYVIEDLYNYDKSTYCSKIVHNAYYYGAGVKLKTSIVTINGVSIVVCAPYDIPNSSSVSTVYKK